MTKETQALKKKKIAEARAEDDFRTAEKKADQRGLVDTQKWAFITGYLQKTLAIAYAS